MKRSEMVEHIRAELEEMLKEHHNVSDKRYPHWINGKASSMLDMMEGFGMLPPQYTSLHPGHFPGNEYTIELNEWEEE